MWASTISFRDFKTLDQNRTVDEWMVDSGLDYRVNRSPAYYNATGERGQQEEGLAADMDVLYRSDTLDPLSVVSGKYRIVQPRDVMGFFRDLVENSGYQLETAGTFNDGRKIWAMCNTQLEADVVSGDTTRGYILLATSYDGSMSTIAKFTPIRVICQNTLSYALRNRKGSSGIHISIPHSSTFNPEVVKDSLSGASAQFAEFQGISKALIRTQVNSSKMDELLLKFVAKTEMEDIKDAQIRASRTYKSLRDLFDGKALGSDIPGVSGTAYQLLASATEYYDHEVQARSDSSRLNSAWFGSGDRAKNRMFEILKREIA